MRFRNSRQAEGRRGRQYTRTPDNGGRLLAQFAHEDLPQELHLESGLRSTAELQIEITTQHFEQNCHNFVTWTGYEG